MTTVAQMDSLLACMEERTHEPGATVASEGEADGAFHLVKSGEAAVLTPSGFVLLTPS